MANENQAAVDPRDERITQLETELKASNDRHELQRKRATKLEAELGRLQRKSAEDEAASARPSGDYVQFRGATYDIIGDFRADNTFAEVKRGHCPEGVTLIAIDKTH